MSHFSVGVFSKTGNEEEIEELLAPYDESIRVESYIYKTKSEIIESAKKHQKDWMERISNMSSEELENYKNDFYESYILPLLNAKTDEEFYQCEIYEDEDYDKDGNLLTTYNPNSKWDWWQIGGRFSNKLKDKNGCTFNTIQLKDLDLSPNKNDEEYLRTFWKINVEEDKNCDVDVNDYVSLYNKEYYLEKYGNLDNFIKARTSFGTYAVLDEKGNWYAPGQMLMFGVSNAKLDDEFNWELHYIERFLENANKELYFTVVDCHI